MIQYWCVIGFFCGVMAFAGEPEISAEPLKMELIYENNEGEDDSRDDSVVALAFRLEEKSSLIVKPVKSETYVLAQDSNNKKLGEPALKSNLEDFRQTLARDSYEYQVYLGKMPSEGSKWIQLRGEIPVELWSREIVEESDNIEWEGKKDVMCGEMKLEITEFEDEKDRVTIKFTYGHPALGSTRERKITDFEFLCGEEFVIDARCNMMGGEGPYKSSRGYWMKKRPDRIRVRYHDKMKETSIDVNIRFPFHKAGS